MTIRAVIVDDEPWARSRLAALLNAEPDFDLVASCGCGEDAVDAIVAHAPDVVFLDVQMPGLDGFGVVDRVGIEAMPLVVFVTAHDDYALRAFDTRAVDYLLKPFDEDRFRRAIRRVRDDVGSSQPAAERVAASVAEPRAGRRFLRRLALQSSGRVSLLPTSEIDWLEAAGNYVTLHVGQSTHLVRHGLSALEAKLDPETFVRLHRSAIVNVERIRELTPWLGGEQAVILQDGTQLTIGRAFRSRLKALLDNSLDNSLDHSLDTSLE